MGLEHFRRSRVAQVHSRYFDAWCRAREPRPSDAALADAGLAALLACYAPPPFWSMTATKRFTSTAR